MSIARIECVGGASGNMLLGALIDAGLDPGALEHTLRSLDLPAWTLTASRVTRRGVAAVHVEIGCPPDDQERHLSDIVAIITGSALPAAVKSQSTRVFERLADAEAAVHRMSRDAVHFHEVGAVDAIVDIVGVVLGMSMLGIDDVRVGALPVGTGPIVCAHGTLPNPAPATAALLRGAPLRFTDIPGELVTPTAAALLATLGRFEPGLPTATIERIGYGAGTRDPEAIANVTRLMVLSPVGHDPVGQTGDEVVQIETNIDDMNPQVFGYVVERLFEIGALDAWLTPIQMKKGRPATLLTALCAPGREQALIDVILAETTTLGVRVQTMSRCVAARQVVTVTTSLGDVRVKIADAHGRLQPEHDDCRRIAHTHGLPLIEVMERVRSEACAALQRDAQSAP